MELETKNTFDDLEGAEPENILFGSTAMATGIRYVCYPWRRYFARFLDFSFYSVLWTLVPAFMFHCNMATRSVLGQFFDMIMVLIMMLFLEPVFLRFCGTTIGKVVFGLRIESANGGHLSYQQGLKRTWGALGIGMGYGIPIYSLVRLWKSYKLCQNQEIQPWDCKLSYTIKDTKWFRAVYFILGYLVSFALVIVILTAQWVPPNRGDLTVEEFAENYNYYAKMLDFERGNLYLDKSGQWAERQRQDRIIWIANDSDMPEIHYTLEDGCVTSVSFSTEFVDEQDVLPSFDIQLILLCFSMLGAQKDVGLFSSALNEIIHQVDSFDGFKITKSKLAMRCNTAHMGYLDSEVGYLFSDNTDDEKYFCIDFSIQKVK